VVQAEMGEMELLAPLTVLLFFMELAVVEEEMEQQVPEVKVAVETVQQVQLTLLTQHKTVLEAEEALMQVETEVQVVTELLL
tara:strand:+ start:455 stop:700 length:246 start_codon:yes stop_codon:yes gene_type:complete